MQGAAALTDTADPLTPGYYWIRIGENPPEVARLHDDAWWLTGRDQPWPLDGAEVVSGRLVLRTLHVVR